MPSPDTLPTLVSTDWLAARLGDPTTRPVDASWYLPQAGRDARAEFRQAHIPGAVYFDLDAASDAASALPHMLAPARDFEARMRALGLRRDDTLVVYDGSGVNLSAPRVWWMFRVYGHPRVALLDGGMRKWRSEGRPVESGDSRLPPGDFAASFDSAQVRTLEEMRGSITDRSVQIVDARGAGRFTGDEPEPRAGIRSGHIPGSANVPYTTLVEPDGTVPPPAVLRQRLESAGVRLDRPVIATCGSGVTACSIVLALHLLGRNDAAVYDGSWTEWGARADTPLETGPARKSDG